MDVGSQFGYIPWRGGIDQRSYPLVARALTLWPRLDRRRLNRCAGDPRRIARLVARRTSLPHSAIVSMLLGTSVDDAEIETWFG